MPPMENKEWYNKTPRAIAILLHLKNHVLKNDEISNRLCLDVFGTGSHAVANYIDDLIDDYNRSKTALVNEKHLHNIYKSVSDEWSEFGFDYSPSEYSEERQKELKSIADRWKMEDEKDESKNT